MASPACVPTLGNTVLTCTAGPAVSFPANTKELVGVNLPISAAAPHGTVFDGGTVTATLGFTNSPWPFIVSTSSPPARTSVRVGGGSVPSAVSGLDHALPRSASHPS